MPDLSFASFAKAEQLARKQTYEERQLRASESLFFIPPNPVICNLDKKNWENSKNKTGHFQPKGFENLFVLSAYAGIPKGLKSSGELAVYGDEIGREAGKISRNITPSKNIKLNPFPFSENKGDIKEMIGVGFQNGYRDVHKIEVDQDNAHHSSNETAGKEVSLDKRHFCSDNDTCQKYDGHEAKNQ